MQKGTLEPRVMSTSIAWSILSSTASHGACCFFGFPLACASCHSLAQKGATRWALLGQGLVPDEKKPGLAEPPMRLWTSPAGYTGRDASAPGCAMLRGSGPPRFFELSPCPASVLPEAEAVKAVAVGGMRGVCLQHQCELGGRNTSQNQLHELPKASRFQRSCSCLNTAIIAEGIENSNIMIIL